LVMQNRDKLPGVEFEGPLGQFSLMEEVPFDALIIGACDIFEELLSNRCFKEDTILSLIRNEMNTRAKQTT